MGLDTLINLIFTAAMTIGGGVLKMLHMEIKKSQTEVREVSNELNRHKLHAAETFATKTDVRDGFDRVMNKLDKIDEKLDTKQDK